MIRRTSTSDTPTRNAKKKNDYGDGSIFERKDGRFVASYRLVTGKRVHRYAKTRKEAKAQLPDIRFHDLRHSAATILLSMGVNVKVIQQLLGHANISITLDIYSHVTPSMQREAMNNLDQQYHHGHNEEISVQARDG